VLDSSRLVRELHLPLDRTTVMTKRKNIREYNVPQGLGGRFKLNLTADGKFRYSSPTRKSDICHNLTRDCPMQMVFVEGQPHFRLCEKEKQPGPLVPIEDPSQLRRQAVDLCKCWDKEEKFQGCAIKGLVVGAPPESSGEPPEEIKQLMSLGPEFRLPLDLPQRRFHNPAALTPEQLKETWGHREPPKAGPFHGLMMVRRYDSYEDALDAYQYVQQDKSFIQNYRREIGDGPVLEVGYVVDLQFPEYPSHYLEWKPVGLGFPASNVFRVRMTYAGSGGVGGYQPEYLLQEHGYEPIDQENPYAKAAIRFLRNPDDYNVLVTQFSEDRMADTSKDPPNAHEFGDWWREEWQNRAQGKGPQYLYHITYPSQIAEIRDSGKLLPYRGFARLTFCPDQMVANTFRASRFLRIPVEDIPNLIRVSYDEEFVREHPEVAETISEYLWDIDRDKLDDPAYVSKVAAEISRYASECEAVVPGEFILPASTEWGVPALGVMGKLFEKEPSTAAGVRRRRRRRTPTLRTDDGNPLIRASYSKGEAGWVEVLDRDEGLARIDNHPLTKGLRFGDIVRLEPDPTCDRCIPVVMEVLSQDRRPPGTTGVVLPCRPGDKQKGKPWCVYKHDPEDPSQPMEPQPKYFPKHYPTKQRAKRGLAMMHYFKGRNVSGFVADTRASHGEEVLFIGADDPQYEEIAHLFDRDSEVYTAPRPLYGTFDENEKSRDLQLRRGWWYAAIEPGAFMADEYRQKNLELAAKRVFRVTRDQVLEEIRRKAEYPLDELKQDYDPDYLAGSYGLPWPKHWGGWGDTVGGPTTTLEDGRVFPVSPEGEVLSWDIGLYATQAEAQLGYPKARAAIAAMQAERPEQLVRERASLTRATSNRMHGHNARALLKLIDSVVEGTTGAAPAKEPRLPAPLKRKAQQLGFQVKYNVPDPFGLGGTRKYGLSLRGQIVASFNYPAQVKNYLETVSTQRSFWPGAVSGSDTVGNTKVSEVRSKVKVPGLRVVRTISDVHNSLAVEHVPPHDPVPEAESIVEFWYGEQRSYGTEDEAMAQVEDFLRLVKDFPWDRVPSGVLPRTWGRVVEKPETLPTVRIVKPPKVLKGVTYYLVTIPTYYDPKKKTHTLFAIHDRSGLAIWDSGSSRDIEITGPKSRKMPRVITALNKLLRGVDWTQGQEQVVREALDKGVVAQIREGLKIPEKTSMKVTLVDLSEAAPTPRPAAKKKKTKTKKAAKKKKTKTTTSKMLNQVVLYGGIRVLRGDMEKHLDFLGTTGPARLTYSNLPVVEGEPEQRWNPKTLEWEGAEGKPSLRRKKGKRPGAR